MGQQRECRPSNYSSSITARLARLLLSLECEQGSVCLCPILVRGFTATAGQCRDRRTVANIGQHQESRPSNGGSSITAPVARLLLSLECVQGRVGLCPVLVRTATAGQCRNRRTVANIGQHPEFRPSNGGSNITGRVARLLFVSRMRPR